MKLTLRKTGRQVAGKCGTLTFLLADFKIQFAFELPTKILF